MKTNLLMAFAASLLSFGAWAADISTAAEFVSAMATDPTGDYTLTGNIDLTDSGYTSIAEFSGSLNGAGYTIKGLGDRTLFTKLTGSVSDLTIDGTVNGENMVRTATSVGMLCDLLELATVSNCVIKGYTLKHADTGTCWSSGVPGNGLFAARAQKGARFFGCLADASCELDENGKRDQYQGGFVGDIQAGLAGAVFDFIDSTNRASVVDSGNGSAARGGSGGFVGRARKTGGARAYVNIVHCANEGAITGAGSNSNIGGFVGFAEAASSAPLRVQFEESENHGIVTTSGNASANSTGGFVGELSYEAEVKVRGCVNHATIGSARAGSAGGFFGLMNKMETKGTAVDVQNAANYGDISGTNVGGFLGKNDLSNWAECNSSYCNLANYGTLTGEKTGEIFATMTTTHTSPVPTTLVDNCWTVSTALYDTYLGTVTTTNNKSSSDDDAAAVEALKDVARQNEGYVLWRIRETHPELGIPGAAGEVLDPVVKLSEPICVTGEDGVSATVTVSVTDTTLTTGTLVLTLNGAVKATWPLELGTYTKDLAVKKGKNYEYVFTASGSRIDGDASTSVSGSFLPIETTGWFSVDLTDDGYVAGEDWVAASADKDGGTWTQTAAGSKLEGGAVRFAEGAGAAVTYQVKKPSELGADLFVAGSLYVDETDKAKLPADVPFAFGFDLDVDKVVCYPTVYANGVWTTFGADGDGFAFASWVDYKVEVDHASEDASRVRVTVGGITSEWLPVVVAKKSVSKIGFTGGGFGSFAGTVYSRKPVGGLLLLIR